MPTSLIKAVEALTERDKQDGNLEFTDRNGNSFVDIQYEGDANQPADGDAGVDEEDTLEHEEYVNKPEQENNDTDDEAPGIHMDIPGVIEDMGTTGLPENTPGIPKGIPGVPVETIAPCEYEIELPVDPEPPQTETEEHTTNPESSGQNEPMAPPTEEDNEDEDENEAPPQLTSIQSTTDSDDDEKEEEQGKEIPDDEVYHPDTMTPSIQSTYGLRPRRARDYIHMHANIVHHAMTQYSLSKGLRKFQKEGEKSVEKELEQLHIFLPGKRRGPHSKAK
jgi:hypothetical protein